MKKQPFKTKKLVLKKFEISKINNLDSIHGGGASGGGGIGGYNQQQCHSDSCKECPGNPGRR